MYRHLDVVGAAEKLASAKALEDRALYRPFLSAAEEFAAETGLIVSGAAARLLLLSAPAASVTDYRYDFFTDRGFAHARELTDRLYQVDPDGRGHYTTLITNVPHFNWSILIDNRLMFTVTALPVRHGVATRDLISTVSRPALFTSALSLLCTSYDLALIELYRDICDPLQMADVPSLLALATQVRAELAAPAGKPAPPPAHPAGALNKLRQRLVDEFIPGPGRVQIGQAAVTGERDAARCGRLQIVSAEDLDREAAAVVALGAGTGYTLASHVEDPKLPGNSRLRRLSVYVQGAQGRTPLIDIYNCAQFELVPFVQHARCRVGTAFVLMRFLLIDLWFTRLHVAQNRATVDWLTHLFREAARQSERALAAAEFESLIGAADYIGRAETVEVALKRTAQAALKASDGGRPHFYVPYMPAAKMKGPRALSAATLDAADVVSILDLMTGTVEPTENEMELSAYDADIVYPLVTRSIGPRY
jgi:hypothetical protein